MSGFQHVMSSKPVVALVKVGATIFLAITLLAAGFAACLIPQATETMANAYVDTDYSALSHDDLVRGAIATRDYSFFGHDKHELLATIYEMNQDYVSSGKAYAKSKVAPDIDLDVDAHALSTEALEAALYPADESYVLTEDAITHLDDVYNVAAIAYPVLVIVALLCIAAFAHVVFYRGWRGVSLPFIIGGGILLVLFAILGGWALADFYTMFNALHSLLFSNGSWLFSYDSLLICMLPQDFWVGLGAIWLGVTVALSILCVVIGIVLRKRCVEVKE